MEPGARAGLTFAPRPSSTLVFCWEITDRAERPERRRGKRKERCMSGLPRLVATRCSGVRRSTSAARQPTPAWAGRGQAAERRRAARVHCQNKMTPTRCFVGCVRLRLRRGAVDAGCLPRGWSCLDASVLSPCACGLDAAMPVLTSVVRIVRRNRCSVVQCA